MTARQRVLLTALPNGLVAGQPGRYRLSVHVAPRLSTEDASEALLSDFPDWVDWPNTVNGISWSVVFGAGPPVAATLESAPARSDLWKALFAGGALVRSHNPPDLSQRVVRSYPARNVTAFIQKHYTDLAVNSPEEFPHIDDLMKSDAFRPLHGLNLLVPNGTAPPGPQFETILAAEKAYTNGPPLAKVDFDFYQLWRFHHSRTNFKPYKDDPKVPDVVGPTLDFHQVVSSCGQYPPLLRLLGLVVDLVVDVGATLPASPNEVRVVPAWTPEPPAPPGSTADTVAARTRCLIEGGQFRPRPRATNPDLVDGRLPFNDTNRFTLLQVDQDGAGLKAIDFADNLHRLLVDRSSATPDHYAVPALRSGGLSVAFANRAVGFHDKLEQGQSQNATLAAGTPGEVVLDAEDVTRGHRIDIRDTREGRWFSLSARSGTYRFPGNVNVDYEDESWTTAAVTEDDTADEDLYLQETLFRWGGWSLAAERPGGRIGITQEEDPPVTTAPTAMDPDFPVLVDTRAAPGSLPRLRFRRRYEARARAVDLAGNSDPLAPTDDDRRRTPPVDYLRFEPVQTPPVLPFAKRTEGESLERVVLRSNHDRPPARDVEVARHVVPPKTSQLLAEQHGLFDTAFPNSFVDPSTYDTITKYVSPVPPEGDVLQSEQGSFATSSERVRDPEDHTKSYYYPVELVTLPYLPDPIARGVALRFLDHPSMAPGGRLEARFRAEPAWPAHKPVRLVVVEGVGAPSYDEESHRITVPLRKADVVHVRLSAYLNGDDLQSLGLWKWIVDGGGIGLRQKVVEGRHWMVTPYRTLTLVHAVKQPLALAQPNVTEPPGSGFLFRTEGKQLGETFAKFRGTIQYSRKSTGKIDVIGSWGEYLDHGPGSTVEPTSPPAVLPEEREQVAFTLPQSRGAGEGNIILGVTENPDDDDHPEDRHEFNDTKHRKVRYTTIATTKFPEYFVQTEDVQVLFLFAGATSKVVTLETGGNGVVPGSVKVKNKVLADQETGAVKGAKSYVEGVHFTVNASAGTVTLRRFGPDGVANFQPSGVVVTIAYLVPPIVRPGPGESVVPAVLSIPSSAPPAAPKPVYAVPTFGWESKKGPLAGHYESRRRGRGLRVYLERPWWSSGEGELLGVVLDYPAANEGPSDLRDAVVTRVGVDPVFKSTDSLPPLNLFDFPAAKVAGIGPAQNGEGYQLVGVPGRVLVSGHEVGYDAARKLWYCDIQVDSSSYFPFIKLGLVRFQPQSVAGAHLSPVVVTDFHQLAPDRFVSVAPVLVAGPGTTTTRAVTMTGQSYSKAGGHGFPPVVRIFVERLDPTIGTDLGWSAVGGVVTLEPKAPSGDDSVWGGQISVPVAPAGTKQRLVIEEFERHHTGVHLQIGERLVYSDVIEL